MLECVNSNRYGNFTSRNQKKRKELVQVREGGTTEHVRSRNRQGERKRGEDTVKGGRTKDKGGGGGIECVNTQEHCIKPMHCSEAG